MTVDCNTVAIFKTSEGNIKLFDSRSRDSYGTPHPFGKCVQIAVEIINNLLISFQNTVPRVLSRGNVTPFEVKGPEDESAKQCVTFMRVTRLSKTCWVAKYSLDPQGHAREKNKQNFLACEHPYNTLLYVLQA